jgi:large subunit ribosomal protein L18
VTKAIVYVGLRPFIHGSRLAASIKGILDAGVLIPVNPKALPSDDRIKGMHIVKYARELSEKDTSLYRSKFKNLLDNGFDPLNYDKYFNETRNKIIKQYGVEE